MKFEYDPAKSEGNKAKHGIDFEEAQALWLDDDRLEVPSAYEDESRYMVIGRIDAVVWTAVATRRLAAIRIISCRRARKKEIADYEQGRTH